VIFDKIYVTRERIYHFKHNNFHQFRSQGDKE